MRTMRIQHNKNGELSATRMANKDCKGVIETFGAMTALRYEKIDLKKSFVFFAKI